MPISSVEFTLYFHHGREQQLWRNLHQKLMALQWIAVLVMSYYLISIRQQCYTHSEYNCGSYTVAWYGESWQLAYRRVACNFKAMVHVKCIITRSLREVFLASLVLVAYIILTPKCFMCVQLTATLYIVMLGRTEPTSMCVLLIAQCRNVYM